MIGQDIAHYRVTAKLGAGGMGEVYRATDTKLGRDVALKVLPEAFAADPQRMTRFQREAQVLASLNHPNIATIHGLEESGSTRALAMELVEGLTLAERIGHGAIPLEEALPMARQIAEALEYAHEKGIVHRDLKPANIKLTQQGQIKVLDFGLAKAMADDPSNSVELTNSPTLSLAATKAGLILGTAAYMAPEQARGKSVDRRADIWSFGVVLYEMLSGRRAFSGDDASTTLAAVIMKEPDFSALPASIPHSIRRLLQRCLAKDPRNRLQAIGEARIAIEEALAHPQAADSGASVAMPAVAPKPMPAWQRTAPWGGMAAFALTAVLAIWRPWQSPPAPPSAVRLSVEIGVDASLFPGFGASAMVSPDGKRMVFAAQAANHPPQLYVRSMDQLQASPLFGTEGARNPFFSPDGEWAAFFAGGKLKKISVQGGAVVTLCDAPDDRGGSWGEDNSIVFAATARAVLSRVPAAGGTPEPLTEFDKTGSATHRWPQVLPGGQAVLFTAHIAGGNFDNASIVVQLLATKERKILRQGGSYARYLPSGHVVYAHQGKLFAVPFDLQRLELTGQPVPALDGVITNSGNGGAQFSFSDKGSLVYSPGTGTDDWLLVFWLEGQGKLTPLRNVKGTYYNPRFSPDGTRLALEVTDGGRPTDVHVYDWKRDTLTRLTFAAEYDGRPAWTPDGRWIAFSSERNGGTRNIYWTRSDGTGEAQRLTESKNQQLPASWHPGGKLLAFAEQDPQTNWDIGILPLEGDEKSGWKPGKPASLVSSPFAEIHPAFSPDGRWLAYTSDENGSFEVYVRPFPSGDGKWQVSTGGGGHATWSPNDRELFYRSHDNKIMVADYAALGGSFRADKPRLWSEVQFQALGTNRTYDLHPDGKRFAILKSAEVQTEGKRDKVTLVQNFFHELRRIAPPGGKTQK